jgi:Icc-related predicted phosphoesterase
MNVTKFEDFIPQNIAPSNAKRIGIYKSDTRVGGFGLSNLRLSHIGNKQYSFGAISDVHIQRTTAKDDFQRALTYFNNADTSFVCVCGDLTESGYAEQLAEYKVCVDTYATKPVYVISGNHESYGGLDIASVIETYTGKPLYYSFEQGNDVFIMLGIVEEYNLFTDAELQWLYETLEANRNKRCFVFQHVFNGKEKEAVCGNAYGLYRNYCWSNATQTTIFESLMEHYKNVIWFHGHSHFRFNLQSKDCTYANIDKSNGYWSVHIPSISVPREDADGDGTTEYYTAGSEGYVVDVYENHIVLRGRDFVAEEFLPIAQYCLDTTLQTIEANTFTDSTGTITT